MILAVGRQVIRVLAYAWAAPTTSLGLAAGLLTLLSRGEAQVRRGALEFHGGFARWLLERTTIQASAMTLGHVIIARTADALDYCRDHEQVHVRQVERWGMFFIPAYLASSVWERSRGRHYYFDNWFERDARRRCGES
jgi:hypothetical protein